MQLSRALMLMAALLSVWGFGAMAQQSQIPFRRGDVDVDAHINITDAVVILLHLYRGEPEPVCAKSADMDDNGVLESADAIYLLVYSFLSGPPPRSPFDDCGFDPTPDELSCLEYPPCPVVVDGGGTGDGDEDEDDDHGDDDHGDDHGDDDDDDDDDDDHDDDDHDDHD